MCVINWPLLLEFVKALAAPVAGVASVVLVSYLGVGAFKRQKAVERRLEWYDQAYCLLGRTGKAFAVASIWNKHDTEGKAYFDAAMESSQALGDHLEQSWLYADQGAHDAVETLGKIMEEVHVRILQSQRIAGPDAQAIANACHTAALEFAVGMRNNLGLPGLDVSK